MRNGLASAKPLDGLMESGVVVLNTCYRNLALAGLSFFLGPLVVSKSRPRVLAA
jgi:hypothetical protein